MKTVNFENATLLIGAIVPFENSLISCDVMVQIAYESSSNFDYDVIEYNNLKNKITNSDISQENAEFAHTNLGLNMNAEIKNQVSVYLTKDAIKALVVKAISVINK